MKLDFNQSLKSLDGKALKFDQVTEFTLKLACVEALMREHANEQISGKEKFERAILAEKIHKAKGFCEVTSEEITQIKELVGRAWPPVVVLPAYKLLEGGSLEVVPPSPGAA